MTEEGADWWGEEQPVIVPGAPVLAVAAAPGSRKRARGDEATTYDRNRRRRISELTRELGRLAGVEGGSAVEVLGAACSLLQRAATRAGPARPPKLSVAQLLSAEIAQPIAASNMRGELVAANSAFAQFLGHDRREMAAGRMQMERFVPAGTWPVFRAVLVIAVAGRFARGRDTSTWLNSDGREVWCDCTADLLYNEERPHDSFFLFFVSPAAVRPDTAPKGMIEVRAHTNGAVVATVSTRDGGDGFVTGVGGGGGGGGCCGGGDGASST